MEQLVSVYRKAIRVVTKPERFFREVKRDRGIDSALKYLAVIAFVPSFFTAALLSVARGPAAFSFNFLLVYAAIIIGTLIGALGIQLFAIVLGGKGSYDATFRSLAYGYTAAALIGWIPWVGMLGRAYTLYLYIKGVSILHSVSMWRAAAIVFLPLILLAIAFVVLFFAVLAALIPLGLLSELGGFGVVNTQTTGLV